VCLTVARRETLRPWTTLADHVRPGAPLYDKVAEPPGKPLKSLDHPVSGPRPRRSWVILARPIPPETTRTARIEHFARARNMVSRQRRTPGNTSVGAHSLAGLPYPFDGPCRAARPSESPEKPRQSLVCTTISIRTLTIRIALIISAALSISPVI
jgi:hypothetical protein